MSGKEIRLAKLFSRGKAVVVALDHGGYMGPIKGIENLPKNINLYKKADAIILNPNIARYCGNFFASHDSPLCIIRVKRGFVLLCITLYRMSWLENLSRLFPVLKW